MTYAWVKLHQFLDTKTFVTHTKQDALWMWMLRIFIRWFFYLKDGTGWFSNLFEIEFYFINKNLISIQFEMYQIFLEN